MKKVQSLPYPEYTTVERDLLVSPVVDERIRNTDTGLIEKYTLAGWVVGDKNYGTKLNFGQLTLSDNPYPVTYQNTFGKLAYRTAQEFTDFDKYSHALFDIICDDELNSYYGMQFSNLEDLFTFINDKYSHFVVNDRIMKNITIKPYFLVNDKVGDINKNQGLNKLYSILRGKNNYTKPKVYTIKDGFYFVNAIERPQLINAMDSILKDVINRFFPSSDLQYLTKDEVCSLFWFGQNNRNLYTQLARNNKLNFSGVNLYASRKFFNVNNNTIHDFSVANPPTVMTTDYSVVWGVSDDLSIHTIYDEGKDAEPKKIKINTKKFIIDGLTKVRITLLVGVVNGNENVISFMVKPYGQDVFRLNYIPNISNQTHDLYIMYYGNTKQHQPIIKKINNPHLSHFAGGDVSYIIERKHWVNDEIGTSSESRYSANDRRIKNFCFFVGDKHGNITNLSAPVKLEYRINQYGNFRNGLTYVDGK